MRAIGTLAVVPGRGRFSGHIPLGPVYIKKISIQHRPKFRMLISFLLLGLFYGCNKPFPRILYVYFYLKRFFYIFNIQINVRSLGTYFCMPVIPVI